MDDEELVNVNFMDLDLNQEPTEPPLRSVARDGSLLNELETVHERIEERIRQLEAVTARARQRQRWRQARNPLETTYIPGEVTVNVGASGVLDENNNMGIVEMTAERGRGCKRDSSHLVAAALATDSEVKKVDKESGGFYDCNICLDVAREPVLTCCGHLFCWPCFYQVSKIDSTSKECPVCKGEVSDNTVIPIYGHGDCEPVCETESGLKIPPRPKACRIESVRQQCVTQGVSHVPVAEALRRIRISIGAMASQTQQQEDGGGRLSFDTSHEGQNAGVAGGRRRRIHQVSRVLSESAASLSTLSSALRNAERLVEDLEAVITNRLLRNGARALPIDIGNLFTRPSAVTQSNNQPTDSATDINAALPIASSSQSTDASGSVVHVPSVRTSTDVSLPVAPSSSSLRSMSRISDLDNRDSRESRRRRLN